MPKKEIVLPDCRYGEHPAIWQCLQQNPQNLNTVLEHNVCDEHKIRAYDEGCYRFKENDEQKKLRAAAASVERKRAKKAAVVNAKRGY